MEALREWQRAIWTGVGGVLAVGVPDEVRAVVGSRAGIGVFDATTGDRVLRIKDNDYAWWDGQRMAILLPTAGDGVESIPSMGLEGGALPVTTRDGWECSRTEHGVVLTRGEERLPLADVAEFRACGFSPAGSLFVLATSPNLTVLRRRQPAA